MEVGKQNYAFEQDRKAASVRGNNSSYEILNARLRQLKPYFDKEDYRIWNCTPNSGLKVFPYLPYEQALERATAAIPKQIVTKGMYERLANQSKNGKPKCLTQINPEPHASTPKVVPTSAPSLPATDSAPMASTKVAESSKRDRRQCNEFAALKRRGFRDYSLGHRRMYNCPITLLRSQGRRYSILDVGFGIGYGLQEMLNADVIGEYTGIEPVSDSFQYTSQKFGHLANVRLINQGWLEVPDRELTPADYVFCIEVVEHLPDDMVLPFLAKLARFTKRNLFLSTPDRERSAHGTRTTAEWRAALTEAGFTAVDVGEQWTTLFVCRPRDDLCLAH
jgi:2-polyprenyl-3-methyl-5-hydroxy-6-metoxy-1,4-benzoquinol methylase